MTKTAVKNTATATATATATEPAPHTNGEMRPVLVTTQHRGVFFGWVPKDQDLTARTMALKGAKVAIYWGTTKGVAELAATGPTGSSKVGAEADIPCLHDITAVWAVTDEAAKKWTGR